MHGRRRCVLAWWAFNPALPLLITEGAKKKVAACYRLASLLWPAGIWNGAQRGPNRSPALLIDLAAVPSKRSPGFGALRWRARRNQTSPRRRRLGPLLEKAWRQGAGVAPWPAARQGLDDHHWPAVAAGSSAKASKPILT